MSFIKTISAMFCYGWMPLYFGSGGKSQANTATTTTTSTSQVNTDQSMMGGDGSVGINGMGNLVDQSVINNTAFTDSSNKSTNFSDSSVKTSSTSFTDSSDRSSKVYNTTTDFGAVSRSLDGMTQLSSLAVNNSAAIIKNGLDSVASQSKDNISVLSKAFEFASKTSAADAQKYTDVLGFAKDSITKANDAYANAKDGGQNKTLMIAAVATVGAVGLAFALKT